jgi:hypothetical protein
MDFAEAVKLAENEFARFVGLFTLKEAENPELTYEEIDALVDYEHPEFANEEDQDMYDAGMMMVAFGTAIRAAKD